MATETYEVTVWNITNGDIERKLWDATWAEVATVIDQYEDEPLFEVQWEEVGHGN